SSPTSAVAEPPSTWSHLPSWNPIFCSGSSRREGSSSGRRPAITETSATRAARFAERTDAKVAPASTRVPPAVASDEIVTQSAIRLTVVDEIRAESWAHLHELLFAD